MPLLKGYYHLWRVLLHFSELREVLNVYLCNIFSTRKIFTFLKKETQLFARLENMIKNGVRGKVLPNPLPYFATLTNWGTCWTYFLVLEIQVNFNIQSTSRNSEKVVVLLKGYYFKECFYLFPSYWEVDCTCTLYKALIRANNKIWSSLKVGYFGSF